MRRSGRSVLEWIGSLNSVDVEGANRIHRFVLSARLGLWPAILLSSFAFGHLLNDDILSTVVLGVDLSLVASVAFLFNDACDVRIDEKNKVHRWSIKTAIDLWLFAGAATICLIAIVLSSDAISKAALIGVMFAAVTSLLYSIFCKKVFLLGNVVAAILSLSPGLILLVDRYIKVGEIKGSSWVAVAFLCAGILFLISREIKFDEFDLPGDRAGKRTTVPMILKSSTLNMVHVFVCVCALSLISVALLFAGKFPWGMNLTIALLACGVSAFLMLVGYRSSSKEKFYKTTRLVMLVIPISILLSF